MSLDQVTNIAVMLALVEMMVLIGLQADLAAVGTVFKDWRRLARALTANYVLVPAWTMILLLVVAPDPLVALGFLVLAVCPGAPFGPAFAGAARADVALAVGLMVLLAASSAVISPLLLGVLTPWIVGDRPIEIGIWQIVRTLLFTQLAPLAAGIVVRQTAPSIAKILVGPLEGLGKLLAAVVVVLILGTQFAMLAEIKATGFLAMLTLLAASLAFGWIAGGPGGASRRSLSLTTSLRNVGVALVIVTAVFPGTAAVSAALAYGIVEIFGSLAVALYWRWSQPAGGVAAT